MDTASGRNLLNRLAMFYGLPYFDIGVRLEADGSGGIEQACGTVHYIQPGGSGLLERGVYLMDDVAAEDLLRADPVQYRELRREGYIRGVREDRPAVISVNAQLASLGVNEFLARLHPYRNSLNAENAVVRLNLMESDICRESDHYARSHWARHLGRGDVSPLLGRTDLWE